MTDRHPFHTACGLVPPNSPDRRTQRLMRSFVELIEWAVEAQQMTISRAGQLMADNGVPLEVACRVLPKHGERTK